MKRPLDALCTFLGIEDMDLYRLTVDVDVHSVFNVTTYHKRIVSGDVSEFTKQWTLTECKTDEDANDPKRKNPFIS